ncbi:hypothetical protein HMPREF3182_00603 [Megasphaera hutchinsoni]|uniref:Uncharacterized protein n=1 Tax=Megasphaera hutchinsoni TaxID=1588748 RepID=A0A134CIV5_9FIRM|nr:hypothetical protein HMPREF3182_00603 [Megasphaera hutchinsoni]
MSIIHCTETSVILLYYDHFSQYLQDYYPNIFRKFTIGLNVKNIFVSIFLNIYIIRSLNR